MKIAFIQETSNQNIGIMFLSSIIKADGHQCELFIEPFEDDIYTALKLYQPDIVGISMITGTDKWVLYRATQIKKMFPQVIIILGGPHPTYFPDIINESVVDIIARGEAELSFPELLHRLENRKEISDIFGLWVKKNGQIHRNDFAPLVEDLSSLPYPDYELYQKYNFFKEQTEIPFNTTRGCPFQCSFCYNNI